jgi:hypothetical protein
VARANSALLKIPQPVDWEIPARLPGRPISELKGKHSGSVAILFNGKSLATKDLSKVPFPMIGMNRTHVGWPEYKGPQPDYLCVVDKVWFDKGSWGQAVRKHPAIINGSWHSEPIGYRVNRAEGLGWFSFDLEMGYASPRPCTTGHLALQFAVYAGFTNLYCLGFDLDGGHFDGSKGTKSFPEAILAHQAQRALLEKAGVNVWVVGSPESKAPFPHVTFDRMVAA